MGEIILGLDLGNGYVKVAGEKVSSVFPAGLVRTREVERILNGKTLDIFKVKSSKDEDNEYYMGTDVEETGDFIPTNTGEGRYKDKYFKIVSESAIAYAIKNSVKDASKEKHHVKIVVGLPSREKTAFKLEDELNRSIAGNHIVSIDGVEIVFEVEILMIVAQPLGTLFNYMFSNPKKINEEFAKKYIGIIDCGTGTTDIDGVNDLNIVDNDRDTFQIGSYSVNQRISDYINKENPYANSTYKTVEKQFESDSYKISERHQVPINDIKEHTINNLSEDLVNKIEVRWQGTTRFDVIFLTGGSSAIFGKEIKKQIEDVEIVKNPQMANAQGFYKYALFLEEANKEV